MSVFKCEMDMCVSKRVNYIKKDFFVSLIEVFIEDRRWIHANPTIYNYYSRKGSINPYDGYLIINDKLKGIIGTLKDKLSKNEKMIFIKGERGAGKTTCMNYFLNTQTREFINNELGKTWVRVDVTKLYRAYLYPEEFSGTNKLNFEKYLYAQLLFVASRYGHENTKMNTEKGKKELGNHDCVLKTVYDKFEKTLTVEGKKALCNAVEKSRNASNFSNSINGKPFDYYEIGKSFFNHAKKNVIIFIDGIDNIDYNTFLAKNVLDELKKFIENYLDSCQIVIAFRNDYYEEFMQSLKHSLRDRFGLPGITPIDIEPMISIEDFIEHIDRQISKYESFKNKQEFEAFKSRFSSIINDVFPELEFDDIEQIEIPYSFELINRLKEQELIEDVAKAINFMKDSKRGHYVSVYDNLFCKNNSCFLSKYSLAIKKFYNLKNNDLICGTVFNNDLREYVLNYFKTHQYIVYNYHKKKRIVKETIDINDFFNNHFLIVHAVIKNGNLYTPGQDILEIVPFRNSNFLNLFNPLSHRAAFVSYLGTLSILKYIQRKEAVTIDEVSNFVKIDKRIMQLIKNRLIEFGYIRYQITENEKDDIFYELTKKCKCIISTFFENIDQLHSYVYKGFLSANLVVYVKRYSPDFSDYIYAAIVNTTILLYDIHLQIRKQIGGRLFLEEDEIFNEKLLLHYYRYEEKLGSSALDVLERHLNQASCEKELKDDIKSFIVSKMYRYKVPSLDLFAEKVDQFGMRERIAILHYFYNKTSYDMLHNADLQYIAFQNTFSKYQSQQYNDNAKYVDEAIEQYEKLEWQSKLRKKLDKLISNKESIFFGDKFDDYLSMVDAKK